MNDDDSINSRFYPLLKKSDTDTKKNNNALPMPQQHAFLSLVGLGNCTLCKISIVLLILTGFFVVRPQQQHTGYFKKIPSDSASVATTDTTHRAGAWEKTLKAGT